MKFALYDEASMIGRDMSKKVNGDSEQLWEQKEVFGGLHIIAIGDFYQRPPLMNSYIFKDYPENYDPLAVNLWQTYFCIYS